ncbi:folate/methotrexate transporter FT1, putative [Eimeria tenella]|uniref:Folate/methotrexate transporter FT1, putative n=1 Tax=Eimeria tenella TaxID=5802 RepID=U6L1W6_EIMTE|nr:folate/methotrexate transporter FT1, putative [Eimeria tenella]CDJ41760.1 folate/methotrexate transporter FT1, putative [Eimeria tenella]|eukprot:XP_013232510.1 folate/methotrexate transporter FT1, putative [Eimeria tenella]
MNAAALPAPDLSDAVLELAALEDLAKNEAELPTVAPVPPKSSSEAGEAEGPASSQSLCGRLFLRPCRSPALYFRRLHMEFGVSLLLCLMSNYLFLKGAAYHMAIAASTPVFREVLKLPAEQHSVATALFMIPWSVKGIVGSVSDLFALGGYHKRSYMLLASGSGVVGSILLIASAGRLTMGIAVAGFFLIMVQASFNDLLCEGSYTRKMAEKPHTGAALTSFVWLCSSVGTFAQAVWVGPVVDHLPFQVVLAPFMPLCAQQLILLVWPWPFRPWKSHAGVVGETYTPKAERFKGFLLREHGRLFACALCLTVCAFGSMVAGLMSDRMHVVGICYWFCSGVCITATVACTMPAHLAKPVLYMFLGRWLVPNISSQFSYWLRAGPDCVADGPHFSWSYLLTWNALAQSIFAFVGVALFQRFVSRWTFRRAFLVTSVLQQLTCLLDVAMVLRWNRRIGIPDKAWYFCSASIIEEVASMWAFMPGCVLISRLCPKNIESTMYAVVAGLQNFAQSMSKLSGNFLCFTLLGVRTLATPGGPACDFSGLPLGIGLAMGVCPLLPISLTFWLVPNIFMDQAVTADGPADAAAAAPAAAAAAAAAHARELTDVEQQAAAASTQVPPSGETEAPDDADTSPVSSATDTGSAPAADTDKTPPPTPPAPAAAAAAAANAAVAPLPAVAHTHPEPPTEAPAAAAAAAGAVPRTEEDNAGKKGKAAAAAAAAAPEPAAAATPRATAAAAPPSSMPADERAAETQTDQKQQQQLQQRQQRQQEE